jgi:oligoribonuclease NrnB/cAMP/cGMP phosphodiesterase (DHH superfamily)
VFGFRIVLGINRPSSPVLLTMTHSICFHHIDPDGHACGAIVRLALGEAVTLIGSDYPISSIPWDLVERARQVIVADFSFPLTDMQRMAAGRELVWIDHHKSAINEFAGIADDWPGKRDITKAACVLTWEYFFPSRPVPKAIVLIGDRDIWRWAEADTGAFNESVYNQNHEAADDAFWKPLLGDDPDRLKKMIAEGAWLRQIKLKNVERMMVRRSFELFFEGYRTLVVNSPGNGDLGDYGKARDYEIVYTYEDKMQPEGLTTSVTLFSNQVDVSVIAKRFGGGGHAGAAGFEFLRGASPFPPGSSVEWDLKKEQR